MAGAASSANSVTLAKNTLAARDQFKSAVANYVKARPPGELELAEVQMGLSLAMQHMADAATALVLAIDSPAPNAIAAAQRSRDQGHAQWTQILTKIYVLRCARPLCFECAPTAAACRPGR